MKSINILTAAGLAGLAFSAQAQLVFTIEGPGVQESSVPGVITEDFDGFATGSFSGATAVGSMSSGGVVSSADQFGGAFGTQFVRPSADVTLTLSGAQNYFGVWWSAGDAANWLDFYDGADLLGTYQVGSIIPLLGPVPGNPYYGNPNAPLDRNTGEPYAYLNFTTLGNSHITSVVFRGGTFEFDNLSITDEPVNPPGQLPGGGNPPVRSAVPDGGTTLGLLSISLIGMAALKRKRRG